MKKLSYKNIQKDIFAGFVSRDGVDFYDGRVIKETIYELYPGTYTDKYVSRKREYATVSFMYDRCLVEMEFHITEGGLDTGDKWNINLSIKRKTMTHPVYTRFVIDPECCLASGSIHDIIFKAIDEVIKTKIY